MLLRLSIYEPTGTEIKVLKAHVFFQLTDPTQEGVGERKISTLDFTLLLFTPQRARVIVSWSEKKRFSIFIP